MELERIFHVWDLPTNLIYIKLEDNFKKSLIDKAKQITKNLNELANLIDTHIFNIHVWRKREFVPLKPFLKLCDLLKQFPEFYRNNLEKNISAFKGLTTSKVIKTKFPWKEDERIIRLVAHLLSDGHGAEIGRKSKSGLPYYRNTQENLREDFKKDLQFFGEVPTNLNIDMLQFSKIISYILSHLYNIKFGTYKGRIPEILYNLSKNLVAQFIKALFDDEANVDDSRIKFTSFNKPKILQIRNLIMQKFPEIKEFITEIKEYNLKFNNKEYACYRFSILSKGLEFYKNNIGFAHKKKSKLLDNYSQRKNRKWNRRPKMITKLLILNNLKEKTQSPQELSNKLNITESSVRAHIKGNSGTLSLVKMGLIKKIGLTKFQGEVWKITEKGLVYLQNNLNKNIKFLFYAKTKLFYLNMIKNLLNTHKYIASSSLMNSINRSFNRTQVILYILYKEGYLNRFRILGSHEEFKYNITEKGITLLNNFSLTP